MRKVESPVLKKSHQYRVWFETANHTVYMVGLSIRPWAEWLQGVCWSWLISNPKSRKEFLLESEGHQCQKGSAKSWNCCMLCSRLLSYLKFFLVFYFLMGKHQWPLFIVMTNGFDSTLSLNTTSGLSAYWTTSQSPLLWNDPSSSCAWESPFYPEESVVSSLPPLLSPLFDYFSLGGSNSLSLIYQI